MMKSEIRTELNRAFKEWAVSCEAMRRGEQILLIRKGGIREEGGTFTLADREFFLMPTYEHQNPNLLQSHWVPRLSEIESEIESEIQSKIRFEALHGEKPYASVYPSTGREATVTLSAYAVVQTVFQATDEAQVNALSEFHIWNPTFVKMRFDYNPYDPLYLLVLRVYNLPTPVTLPLIKEYIGCKSWVTLERPLALEGAAPALTDAEFGEKLDNLNSLLGPRLGTN